MTNELHTFHIPVMGIGHSIDTPIRVAPLGITSVISLVDDYLCEKIREHYSKKYNLPFEKIPDNKEDGRAHRITAYLDMVRQIVHDKMEAIRKQPFFEKNDKSSYFDLLPDQSPLKKEYLRLKSMPSGSEREGLLNTLSSRMKPGSIDVNIMVKLDRPNYDRQGKYLGDEFTDAKAALRGFANSQLRSSIVFSAGMNPKLFSYATRFRDFYRDACGDIKKKIILKVSDYRSALTQSKFLAKRGLEVSEFRVESGLNCGGHAFPSRGQIIPWIMKEFKEKWHQLTDSFESLVKEYYEKNGWTYATSQEKTKPHLTVQGGIGNHGEALRLHEEFGADRTGWGSPFLLVPEVTTVDDPTREILCHAKEEDLYLSDISPLGVPFNTVRGTGSETYTKKRIEDGRPGSPCPNGNAVTNTEFTEKPICIASRHYQKLKLDEIANKALPLEEKEKLANSVKDKACICNHLGNGILIKLGIEEMAKAPPAICPGPNIAWFDRLYTLQEMVDHIYGRGPSLVPDERPHMFAKEIIMNVDYFEKLIGQHHDPHQSEHMHEYKVNLDNGMALCLELAKEVAFPGENLASIPLIVEKQQERLHTLYTAYLARQSQHISSDPQELAEQAVG